MTSVRDQAVRARAVKKALALAPRKQKDQALGEIAARLRAATSAIGDANARDLEAGAAAGLQPAMLDRLRMDAKVVEATARAVEHVASLPDPVGSRGPMQRLANGLQTARERLPLGVIGIIYESRPNVTVDAAVLCLKAGNAVLLRGGKEAAHTNAVLGRILQEALEAARLPGDSVQIVPPGDRESVREMIGLTGLLDLVIPRGGEGLVRFVCENARVPVVQHYKGVCHLFLDADAELERSAAIAVNAKAVRPGTCNSLECMLVHEAAANRLLPGVAKRLLEAGVELRGDPTTCALVPEAKPATDDDYGQEFLAKILAVKVVKDIGGAIEHIERYGSNHTEAIVTNSYDNAQRFVREIDASCVVVNASTRFNDGGELGLGAEIGISTSKMHAYGPMGLESLTAEKWIVF
ncbi:MAG TPA: glutamate-5-semialdehyde dehydrogenase, partial [Polyangiaceae bacterium]|nr:glutamate-5-semialdehyde dehydrogenase [Polyangiaceae bacterium]